MLEPGAACERSLRLAAHQLDGRASCPAFGIAGISRECTVEIGQGAVEVVTVLQDRGPHHQHRRRRVWIAPPGRQSCPRIADEARVPAALALLEVAPRLGEGTFAVGQAPARLCPHERQRLRQSLEHDLVGPRHEGLGACRRPG